MRSLHTSTNGKDVLLSRIEDWPAERVEALVGASTGHDVERALRRDERTLEDLAALISPAALPLLEDMAQEAQRLTRRFFGRTVGLYAPIYLANICSANCPYCGFSAGSGNHEKRVSLGPEELRRECEALVSMGFDTTLLLTGEAPTISTVEYIADSVRIASEYFSSVSVEVYAMDREGYGRLCAAGLEGVTLYMETYDRATYERLHVRGIKKDYVFRLRSLEQAGSAGARRLNLGALLGLHDWRAEAIHMGLHARHLQRVCWRSSIAVSFPRLRNVPGGFSIAAPVSDAEFVQLLLAMRLFLPQAGFALSTREIPEFRDKLIPLGITMMSAGSSTRPGGYASGANTIEQFPTEDRRTPPQVIKTIKDAGYDPVWKDSDREFYSF